MRVEISGTRAGRAWPRRGGWIDLPESEARKLIVAGMAHAVPVETAAPPEAEVSRPAEVNVNTATTPVPENDVAARSSRVTLKATSSGSEAAPWLTSTRS
jgi:hypothetical protein